ncbi:MAG: sulfite exporter TauE/SafE family protein [Candidatus Borkfalkiaceae bacterium]|nr:sulfite exporter TauE/SafE family protein [Christensenellaceae bacterium]
MLLFFLLFLAGFLSGVLGGMGMGGGTVLIPALTIFFSIGQTEAQGINLISFIPMAIIAVIIHAKNRLIKFKDVLKIAIPASVFALSGSFLVRVIEGDLQTKLFGGFLVILSVVQFFMIKKENG